MIDRQDIEAVRIGGRWMILHDTLLEFISSLPTNIRPKA